MISKAYRTALTISSTKTQLEVIVKMIYPKTFSYFES